MSIAGLFTRARTGKQPKCPSAEEQVEKIWYIHTTEYYSAKNRKEIVPFAESWMDLEIVIQSEASQTEKSKCRITSLICGI